MVTCSKCGTTIMDDFGICPNCGSQILQSELNIGDSYENLNNAENFVMGAEADYYNKKNREKSNVVNHKDTVTRVLLFILVIFVGYLVFSRLREKNVFEFMESSNRVLVVYMNSDDSSDSSDMLQIKNAFSNGGMIKIDPGNINSELKSQIEAYGAYNADSMYWVTGAILNYIASRGWKLVQAPTTGLVNCYYFVK